MLDFYCPNPVDWQEFHQIQLCVGLTIDTKVMPFELIGPLQEKKINFSPLGGGDIVATPSITLSLSNFRAKTQLKISLK